MAFYGEKIDADLSNAKLHAPATERNFEPILALFRRILPRKGTVLEIAAGTGQHALRFSAQFPDLTWVPSDFAEDMRASIAAYRAEAEHTNLEAPLALDCSAERWALPFTADAMLCINMIHISPWACTQGLMRHAANHLSKSGVLYLYGPYKQVGIHTAPSNAGFDASLQERDPSWGVRHLEDVVAEAEKNGLRCDEVIEMPANNLSVVIRRG